MVVSSATAPLIVKKICVPWKSSWVLWKLSTTRSISISQIDITEKKYWRRSLCRPVRHWTSKCTCCTQFANPLYYNLNFFDTCYTLYELNYMLNKYKRYLIIDIPLTVLPTNYNTNYIDRTILNMVQVELEVSWIIIYHNGILSIIIISWSLSQIFHQPL